MQDVPPSVTEAMPSNYHITRCQAKDGSWCGCYTALKDKSGIPNCKIHGENADQGAEAVLGKVQGAGYAGPVFTQFPIYSEGKQCVSRHHASMDRSNDGRQRKGGQGKGKGGQYHGGTQKVDILLCSWSCKRLAAIEVQGENHREGRVKRRDRGKKRGVDFLADCSFFEMSGQSAKEPKGQVTTQAGTSGSIASSRSKREIATPIRLQNTLSPQRCIAHEVVAFLR